MTDFEDMASGGFGADISEPVFREPWQAQAFAMTLRLYEGGHFTWGEWAEYLGAEITRARERGALDDGSDYYRHWLAALEHLVADKQLIEAQVLAERRDAWDRAARATPHGQPIVLGRDQEP